VESDLRFLLIDSPEVARPLSNGRFQDGGLEIFHAGDEETLRRALELPWDVIVTDSQPSFLSGPGVLDLVRGYWPSTPLLVVSEPLGDLGAVALMRRGATDVLLKDHLEEVPRVVERLLREAESLQGRLRVEAHFARLGRIYRVLAEANQAIVRIQDSGELLQTVCSLVCRLGPFDRVRVTQNQSVILVTAAEAGQGDSPPYFWEKHVMAAGRMVMNNDLSLGGEPGYDSWGSAALYPLRVSGMVWGCFGVYCHRSWAFTPEESALLQDLAEDLGHGLEQRIENTRRRETEQFLADMANLVPGVFYKIRYQAPGGAQFQYVSPGIDLLLPLSPDQVQADAQKVFRALHPGDRMRFYRAATRSRTYLTVFNLEFRLLRPNGAVVWVLATAFPQMQSDGAVIWTGLAIDATPQHKLQEALQREQELVTVILNNIGDGVIAVDEQDEPALVNQTAARLLDLTVVPGSPWPPLDPGLPWHARDQFHPWFRRRPDGTVLHLEVHVSNLATPGRGPQGRVMLLRDMTDRDRIEERLRQSEKLESIGLLAGGIAHDFNNLMTGVFGFIQLARMNAEDPQRVVSYLDHAQGPFQRARTLTQQLLTFARGGEPSRTPLRLGELLPGILDFTLAGSPVSWHLANAESVWPVLANEAQLHQVFENLFLNAKQAMPSGGLVRVALANVASPGPDGRGLEPGPYVEIQVVDEGLGIPLDVQSKVFDPFFTTKSNGTGLGLSICFSVVKKHLGTIEVESEEGRGTLFRIFWPATVTTPGEGVG